MTRSFCWFTAYTFQNAAYVNALVQIKLIFSLTGSVFFFKERITKQEFAGLGFLTTSIFGFILLG